MDANLVNLYIWMMFFGTLIFLATFIGYNARKVHDNTEDGTYKLKTARAKAKADLIINDTLLKLSASPVKKEEFEHVHATVERMENKE